MNEKHVELIGIISGSLSCTAFIPQVIDVIRKNSVEGLSGRTMGVYTLSLIGWTVYGVNKPDYVILIFNTIALVLTGIIDAYFIKSLVK